MKAFRQLAGPLAHLLGIETDTVTEDSEVTPEKAVADNLLSFAHLLQGLHLSAMGQDVEAAVAYQAARETARGGGLMMMFGTSASSDAFYVLGRFYLDTAIDVPRAGYVLRRGLASVDMGQESQFIPEDFAVKLGAIDLLTNPTKTGIQIVGDSLTASHGYASHAFQILASGDDEVAQGLRAHFAEVKKQTLAASALVNKSGTGIVLGAGRLVVFPLVELLRERLPTGAPKYDKFLLVELGADISKRELKRLVEAGTLTAEEASRVEVLSMDATGILEGATGYIDKAMTSAFPQEPRKVPLDKLTKLYQVLADPQLINRLVLPGRELMVPENSINLAVFAMAIQDFASPIRKYIDTWLELFPVDRETKEALKKLDGYSGLIQKNITAVILHRLSREVMPGGVVFLGDTTGMVSGKGSEQKRISFYTVDSLSGLVPQGLPFEAANPASWLRPNNAGKPDLFFFVESLALRKIQPTVAEAGLEEAPSVVEVFQGLFKDGNPARMAGADVIARLQTGDRMTIKVELEKIGVDVDSSVNYPDGRLFVQKGAVVPLLPLGLRGVPRIEISDDPAVATQQFDEHKATAADMAFLAPAALQRSAEWDAVLQGRLAGIIVTREALATLEQLVLRDPAYLAAFVAGARQGTGLITILSIEVDEQTPGQRRLYLYA